MAKKIKIFSELILGVASAFTLGYAVSIKPASACINDTSGETDCAEVTSSEVPAGAESLLVSEPEDLYSDAAPTVQSKRQVNHSFFLAGNQVESSDIIHGLAAFAGNGVVFSGASDYATLAGNSIIVSGSIKNDLFVAGSAIELTDEASIGRDVFGVGSTILIKTNLNGNAFLSGSRLVLENVTIAGDLKVGFDEIVIKGKSAISGTFEYNDNALVSGLENLSAGQTVTYTGTKNSAITFNLDYVDRLVFLLGRLLVTIVAVALCAKFSKRLLAEFDLKNSWKDLALGLVLLVVVPLVSIFVMVTIIGLPLGFIGLAVYILFAYLANSVTGGVLGHLLAEKLFKQPKMHIFLQYALGIVLIELLTLIPYVGSLIGAISVCFGFGYLAHKLFRQPAKAKK
ncbi:hypothetical protein IJF89_00965 [Candidatus Saccharibacteria bacterium]|nr:hypothetical protein [Candidatus Saccharibacteria bacterium]